MRRRLEDSDGSSWRCPVAKPQMVDMAMAETAASWHAAMRAAGARAGMGQRRPIGVRTAASFELTSTEKPLATPDNSSSPLSPPQSEDPPFPERPHSELFHARTLLEPQAFVPNRSVDLSSVDLAGPSSHVAGSMLVNPGDAPPADALAAHNVAAEPAPIAPSTSTASMDVAVASAPDAPPSAPASMPPPLLDKAADALPVASADLNGQAMAASDAPFPSLDAPISLTADMSMGPLPMGPEYPMMDADLPFNNGYASVAPAEQRLSAFARLRFDDGSYYMHTYQIILGRNVQLAHKDMRRLAKVEQLKAKGEKQRAQALLNGGRKRKLKSARSVISEAGGIVTAPIEMMPVDYQQRCQSVASQSHSSGSHAQAAESNRDVDHAPQEMLMQALPEVPYQIDQQVPEDPNDCPLVPIHPQHITDRTGLKGPKGISRQHAKIYYDFDSGNFCLAVMGSNGLYHEDRFLAKGANVELSHGDTIIIGMVEMTFFLPDIALTEEQRNRQESGSQSRPMSFSFENGRGESEDVDDSGSEDQSVNPRHVYHYPVGSEFESDDDLLIDEDMDDLDDEAYSPVPQPKPNLKIKLKKKKHRPEKHSKGHKRKAIREPSPEEPPFKKHKIKIKEKHVHKEPPKEKEVEKEKPKEKEKAKANKAPTKAPTKAPAKAPAKEQTPATPKEEPKDDVSLKDTIEATEKPKSESPVIIRRPQPGVNIEDLDPDGLITPEMCAQYGLPHSLIGQYVGKRKGPGRPPKDGVMSKRQRSQLIKQGKEIEKARAAGIDPADLPQPIVKPKVARRKESNAGEDDEIRESTEKGDGTVMLGGEKKTNKPAKPTRTPSPEMRIEDYTEEQLQRPTSNYVVLIHEAISSAPSGQMNLQQIYNYIEKNYPWYKFKTTTSGWQSSVRHNLGQHDAFVKGDKEGKGYMWRINSNVSIEKERRKRQVSPPQVNAQRPTYYPPPTGYSPYGQPGYYPGMPPQGMPPNGPPRPPPVEAAQPRLPPSMARNAAAAPPAAPAPSPYASPWAGGAAGGNPSNSHPPQPYPPSAHAPSANPGAPSGQYGVLFPTSAPPSSGSPYTSAPTYTSPFATAGQSPYGMPNGASPYTPYPPAGQPPKTTPTPTPTPTFGQAPGNQAPQRPESSAPHPSGRYPASTNPDLIRQLEAFRTVYLHTRIEPGEDKKADNAIRAFVTPELESSLTQAEAALLDSIKTIPMLEQLRGGARPPIKPDESTQPIEFKTPVEALASIPSAPTTTAAIAAADAAANTAPNHPAPVAESSQPQRFVPPMTATPQPSATPAPAPTAPPAVPAIANVQAQRPSVEPITPVPGSPAVRNGTPVTRPVQDAAPSAPPDAGSGAEEKAPKAEIPAPPVNEST